MNTIINALRANSMVTDYKINTLEKESTELFFVKGKLETLRHTDTRDQEVTVYVRHDGVIGSAQFFVYPSTTEKELSEEISEAVEKALLMQNQPYALPAHQEGNYLVESNFRGQNMMKLAEEISDIVLSANVVENGSLNSVEVFVNRYQDTICNSNGLHKTQERFSAMVEAIPTYNGSAQSVELYEQYSFSSLNADALKAEIVECLEAAKARYNAVKPDFEINCNVILNTQELSQLMNDLASNLRYSAVYSHSGVYRKGEDIQKDPSGDRISITMAGSRPGCTGSAMFDSDGISLGEAAIVKDGLAVGYFGSNRFGQYLGEEPTGLLRCLCVKGGSAEDEEFTAGPSLEIVSMSGLQVDFFSDYIGGEVRLAYYNDGKKIIPVTGISISGQLRSVLNSIVLSRKTVTKDNYVGPEKAILSGMKTY